MVEDDKNIREMLVEYFSKRDKEKFNITLAENGLKGLDKAYENSYDLLLLDVMLPEMDGFTLCKEIRRYSDVPIMFITARTSEADMLNGYALGCDDYIVKPIALPGKPSSSVQKDLCGTICLRWGMFRSIRTTVLLCPTVKK